MHNPWVPLLTLSLAATCATAQEFKFSGFGTLAATQSSEKKADFISNFAQPNGPGFTRSPDFGVDSRLGGQVDLKMGEQFSAVVQAVAEHRYDNHYLPYLNMALVKWEFSPGFSFRLGRLPYSAYLISDYQKVGYATPWVRPPVEVYQFNPLTSVDGVDFGWRHSFGDLALAGQFAYGKTTVKLAPSALAVAAGPNPPDAEFKGEGFTSVSLAAFYGHSTFRAFHGQMKGTYNDAGFDGPSGPFTFLRYSGPVPTHLPPPYPPFVPNPAYNPGLADQYQIKKDKVVYDSVAFQYDPGNWFFMIEETKKSGDEDMLLHFTAGYATLGLRLGNWTPYATAGWKHTTSPLTSPNPVIQAVLAQVDHAQSSVSAGLRWDFATNLALKAQYDRVKNATGSFGALTNAQPGFKTGESYNLSTIALEFVF